MKTMLMISAAVLALASPAAAQIANTSGLNSDPTIAQATAAPITTNNNTAVSAPTAIAAGGTGIAGASSISGSNATAGALSGSTSGAMAVGGDQIQGQAIVGSGNSDVGVSTEVRNTNTNLNALTNDQGQMQGQHQSNFGVNGQHQSTDSSAYSGDVTSANTNTLSTSSQGGASSANNAGNAQTVNVDASTHNRRNTPMSYAAPLSIGGGVCAYSPVSGGMSLPGFSGSASVGKIDASCEIRAFADVLSRLGRLDVAITLLQQDERVAKAFKDTPEPAPAPVGVVDTRMTTPETPEAPTATMEPIPNP